ncbi:MAG: chorismate mutase [Christensenellales bacterium]
MKKIIAPHNVHLHIDLIAGLPYEEYKTFGRSFNRAFALRPHMLQLGFLKMLHGSKVRRQAETLPEMQYCFGEHPPYEVQSNRWIGREELAKLHEVEDALERMYNSGRFLCTLEYVLQATGWDAFSLFERFGAYAKQQGAAAGTGLDAYTLWIKCFFEKAPGVEAGRLRDCLVTDRLSCDNTGRIPPFLRIEDNRLKKAKRQARVKLEAQGKIGVALLYDPLRVAAFDYAQKDVITGRYAMQIFDLRRTMNQLEQARKEINEVDAQMAALFERRMKAAEQVAAYKKQNGLPILDKSREKAVIEKNLQRIEQDVFKPYYQSFLEHLMALSKEYQATLMEK